MFIERSYTDKGTFGRWYTSEMEFICYSMENIWNNNTPRTSCIPEGEYILADHMSPIHGSTYAVHNPDIGVSIYPGDGIRHLILFCDVEVPSQLHGCIAPGLHLQSRGPEWGIASARQALGKVFHLAKDDMRLTIRSASPPAWPCNQ